MRLRKENTTQLSGTVQTKALRDNFKRIERKEWWLWVVAFVITLLITATLALTLIHGGEFQTGTAAG